MRGAVALDSYFSRIVLFKVVNRSILKTSQKKTSS